MTENWTRVAATSDVGEGEMLAVEAGDAKLALYHVGGEWFCTSNICTHAFALLTEGWLDEHIVECPLHAGQFDIRDGTALCPPATDDLPRYAVRVDGDDVLVAMPDHGKIG